MKTACIYHSIDLDGWMSAAIVKHWFIQNNKEYFITNEEQGLTDKNSIGFGNQLHFIGYNYGQPIPDILDYDKVIMCDISFNNPYIMYNTAIEKELIWIDHHISALNLILNYDTDNVDKLKGIRDTKFAACELTWKYFFPNETIPEIVRLLGRYDCFGHKGTDEHLKVLEFQYGARQCMQNYEDCYKYLTDNGTQYDYIGTYNLVDIILKSGKSIYSYLCQEAKQVYKNGFGIEFEIVNGKIDTKGSIATITHYKFICINRERFNPINFGIDYHKEGYDGAACFHYANGMWNFSLYNDNGLVDCSVIAKQYGGGGHKGAAGFIIKDINQIIK